MNTTLIGITGRKGSGKDAAAKILVDHGYTVVRFAAPLKEMLRTYLRYVGVDDLYIERMIEGDLKEEKIPALCDCTPRWVLQSLGTDWGRLMINDRLWVDAFVRRIRRWPRVVCTDVRYSNEADAIKAWGGKLIRIVRPGTDTSDTHSSEQEIDLLPVDAEIINNGTIEQLQNQLQIQIQLI